MAPVNWKRHVSAPSEAAMFFNAKIDSETIDFQREFAIQITITIMIHPITFDVRHKMAENSTH
jgi:hypothetical protein